MGKSKAQKGEARGQAIFLLGFMGSGKTYWARRLAERLGWNFLDLDEVVKQRAGCSVAQIFEEKGEAAFRELERETLHSLTFLENTVVATGGGTPCFYDNLDWMRARGLTIYLQAPAPLLAQRLQPEKALRPLLAYLPENGLLPFIEGKLAERLPFYEQADKTIQMGKTDEAILAELMRLTL